MQEDNYQIQWTEYSDHFQNSLHSMLISNELTDVTLVCDDKKVLKAHKLVLSTCSSVFRTIIQSMPGNNSLIYLRGIHHQDMESILQYMYIGGAEVKKEKLDDFLKLATNLELAYFNKLDLEKSRNENVVDVHEPYNEISENPFESFFNVQEYNESLESQPNYKPVICSLCDYQAENHVLLRAHQKSEHEIDNNICNVCDFQASSPGGLKRHLVSVHSQKYECEKCSYSTKDGQNLKRHIKIVHEKIKYSCSQCSHKASTTSHLKSHMLNKHLGNLITNIQDGKHF